MLCAAQFLVILDTSIIGVALPAIQHALHFTQEDLQWVFKAYVISYGGLLLLGGRLSDLFGQRRLFMGGFLLLTLASLLAGLAWSEPVLIIARALQGVGAALSSPAALSLVMGLFTDPRELGKAMGLWGASAAAGGSAGVFFGGVITQWLSWQWIFLIYVPFGLLVLLLCPGLLPEGSVRRGRVEYVGALLVTGALVLAVYAIATAEYVGWGSLQTIGLLVLAALLLGAFLLLQRVQAQPLIPLRIFTAPNLSAGNVITALLAATWIPLWYFLNLYLQQVLGYSALTGGLALLPITVTIMILMVTLTARLVHRFGFKTNLVIGLLCLAASLGLFALAPTHGNYLLHVLPASLLAALGMVLAYVPATIAAMSGAQPEDAGLASGLVNSSYQIGSALGLAAMVALSTAITASSFQAETNQIIAINAGFHAAFAGAAIIGLLGALLALVWLRQPKAFPKVEQVEDIAEVRR
ncbi:MFS transporter [Dictyobacter halimunensis]|uniref:MFS transporter n=1 Tax=Dictyobacter halimunensis TaxID=3026934 RepID=UPI0030C6A42E